MILFTFILACYGMTNIIVNANITQGLRDWVSFSKTEDDGEGGLLGDLRFNGWPYKLINCVMCVGFWVGILANFIIASPTENLLFNACLGSGGAWVIHIYLTSLNHPEVA